VVFNKILGGIWRRLDPAQLEDYHSKAVLVFKKGGTIDIPPYIQPFNTDQTSHEQMSRKLMKHPAEHKVSESSYEVTKLPGEIISEDRIAYSCFAQELQGLVTALYPDMKMEDVAKVLTKMWTKCSEVEKNKYYRMVNNDFDIPAAVGEDIEDHDDKTENILWREEPTIPTDETLDSLETFKTVDDISTEDMNHEVPQLAIKIVSVVSLQSEFQEVFETDNLDEVTKNEEANQSENGSIEIITNNYIHQVKDSVHSHHNLSSDIMNTFSTAKRTPGDFSDEPEVQKENIDKNKRKEELYMKTDDNAMELNTNTKEELRSLIGALVSNKDYSA